MNTLVASKLSLALASALMVLTITPAQANSTIVTDAIGTPELWEFEEVLGVQKLLSKTNQLDGKGITQTWDNNGNKLSRTDAEGRTTTYSYNATNQRTSMTEASGTPEARTTTYEYVNADIDLVTKTTSPSIFAGNNKEVVNTYDGNLNITAVTISGFDALGSPVTRATTFEHDQFGKVTEIDGPRTDVSDITTLSYYNCATGARCGQLESVTNALGHVTSYDAYDAAARLLRSTDANGVETTYVYHPRGWLLSMTQTPPTGAARVSTYEYDNVGQMSKVTQPDGTEQNYVYNAAHELVEISDNLGNKVTYAYDAKGNRTDELVFDPDGTLVRSTITTYDIRNYIESINSGGSVTQMINDAVGNLSTQTDPNNNPSTEHDFDALDRLSNTVDALTNDSGYEYNVADQLIQVTAANGATTQYEYDDLGNQSKEISPDRGTITYSHDDAGNVTSMTDARGITTSYSYDALNRLIDVSYPNTSENITYAYDIGSFAIGRMHQGDDDSGVVLYEYDPWGNVTKTTSQPTDENETTLGTFVTQYQYDAANRVIGMTYPNGRTVSITRDAIGRLIGVQTTNSGGVPSTLISSRSYRADGRWTSQTYGNGLTQSKSYDTQSRLTEQNAGSYQRQYAYDDNGNIIDLFASDSSFNSEYHYDVLDRLERTNNFINGVLQDFAYDANGNRQQFTQNSQSSNLNYQANSNRLDNIDGSSLTIDASGRTLQDEQGRQYTYNDAGRLASLSINNQIVGRYSYNSQQLRTHKIASGINTLYHYDLAGNLILETGFDGTVYQDYIYADGERIATETTGVVDVINPASSDQTLSNLALGKNASQSTTTNNGVASRAVDGNTSGIWNQGSVTHTANSFQPWWQVDLGTQADIQSITLHNRTNCCTARLSDFYVFVSDAPFANASLNALLADPSISNTFHSGALSSASVSLPLVTQGQYVRVQLLASNPLSLAEVEVMGAESSGSTVTLSPPANLSQGKVASQSTTNHGGIASRAVDGNTSGVWNQGSVTHTANSSQPWWQVDLGESAVVQNIVLHNRTNCCSQRLSNFYVFVSETPFGNASLANLLADSSIANSFHSGTLSGSSVDIPIAAQGQYVRVQLSGSNALSLAEVEVIGSVVTDDDKRKGVGDKCHSFALLGMYYSYCRRVCSQ